MPQLRLNNFAAGIYTRGSRSNRPVGSLDDCQNLVLNKRVGSEGASLVQRSGSITYLSGAIVDVGGATQIGAAQYDDILPMATESPASTAIDIVCGNSVIVQKPFFDFNGATSSNWVQWGELNSTTVSGASVNNTFVLTAGSATNDYYKYWIAYNVTQAEYVYVSGYNGTTKTITAVENIPGWSNLDVLVLYRYFHDNVTFVPAYSTTAGKLPCALQFGNSIIFSGGQSSNVGNKPIISVYTNKVFFTGATKTLTYKGTYVSEAEVKSTNGITIGNVSEYASVGNGLDTTATWFVGVTYETEDGQRSALIKPTTHYAVPSAADKGLQFTITIGSQFNKRLKYINTFLGKAPTTTATTLDWSEYFFMNQQDLTATGWTYNESGAASGNWTKTIQFDIRNWNATGEDVQESESLVEHLGTTAYTSAAVSFSNAETVNGRPFVARYYDYVSQLEYSDQVRFGVFAGNGVAQFTGFYNLPSSSESTVESGDPTSIQAILGREGNLFILKDRKCFVLPVGADPLTWRLTKVADIGCDAPYSAVSTPMGILWAKGAEDIYLWDGGYPKSMAKNWLQTYVNFATTNKASWRGWWDLSSKTYNLQIVDYGVKDWFSMHSEIPVDDAYAWVRHQFGGNITAINRVRLNYIGEVYILTDNSIVRKMSTTAVDDSSTTLQTSFDTGDYVLDERNITRINEISLANDQDASATIVGTLDCQLLIDGTDTTTAGLLNMTKTKTFWNTYAPLTAHGRRFRFKFNTNASKARWTATTSTATQFTIHELILDYSIEQWGGDLNTQT